MYGEPEKHQPRTQKCGIAFETLALERVYLYVLSINPRANRFYQKAGFTHEGTLRSHVMHGGALCDEIWYGMLKEDYEHTGRQQA